MLQTSSVLLNRLLARARFRHMQVLVQLAELGNVRRTAEAIGMTQPGVTQILADLESLVEVSLFHRHARGVRPTAACIDILPMARQMLQAMAASVEAVAARRGRGEGVIRLMASTAALNGMLLRALPEFSDRFPSIQIQLKESGETDEMLLAVARGEADIVACRNPPVVPQGSVFHPLLPDALVVACSVNHPLARRRQVKWADLEGETWLPQPLGSIARERFDVINQNAGSKIQFCQVLTRVPAATWWLLRSRPLLCFVPASVVRHLVEAKELVVLPMKEPTPLEPLGMLLPDREISNATTRLSEFLQVFMRGRQASRRRLGDAAMK